MNLFYTAVFFASAFVVHKLVWLVQYRKLQVTMVQAALRELQAAEASAILRWDGFTERTWGGETGTAFGRAKSLGHYLANVTKQLDAAHELLRTSRAPLRAELRDLVRHDREGAIDERVVLRLPRLAGGEPIDVRFSARLPRPAEPPALDPSLFELKARSRYGRGRRALVFFLGIADVIYSTQHMTVMSENPHTPVSVLMRRISLVILLLGLTLLDLLFQVRKAVSVWIAGRIGITYGKKTGGDVLSLLHDALPDLLGLAVWTGIFSGVYFVALFVVRRKSVEYAGQLEKLRVEEAERRRELRARHVGELGAWTDGFGQSLDKMVELSAQNAMLLLANARERLHRRAVGEALRRMASRTSAWLLAKLPEAKGELTDELSTQQHSLAHYWWPKADEMGAGVRHACLRAALHDIEFTIGLLQAPAPDLAIADQLWKRLLAYTRTLPEAIPEGAEKELEAAYRATVEKLVRETQEDLRALDRRLEAIAEQLGEHLKVTAPLLEFQVTRADERIEASVAELEAQVRSLRERARLEAMAFEI